MAKKPKTDNSVVQFVATMRDDGKSYDVNVFCAEGLSEEEFADSLMSLAKDIYMGHFSFDQKGDVVTAQ